MTVYLVLEEHDREDHDPLYKVIGQADEGDAAAAIRAVAADTVDEGDVGRKFWATPLRSWRGLEVKTKVVVDTKQLTFPQGDEVADPPDDEATAADPPRDPGAQQEERTVNEMGEEVAL